MPSLNGKKIEAMYLLFGAGPADKTCRDCENLVTNQYANVYHKCRLYGIRCSEATDWRVRWPACGMFDREPEAGFVPVVDRLKHIPRRKTEPPIDGQTTMEGI